MLNNNDCRCCHHLLRSKKKSDGSCGEWQYLPPKLYGEGGGEVVQEDDDGRDDKGGCADEVAYELRVLYTLYIQFGTLNLFRYINWS